jgi:hypothetical protein
LKKTQHSAATVDTMEKGELQVPTILIKKMQTIFLKHLSSELRFNLTVTAYR